MGGDLDDALCESYERAVGKGNCIAFEGKAVQIPPDRRRMYRVRVQVRVHRYPDGRRAVFRSPRCLTLYDAQSRLMQPQYKAAAQVHRLRPPCEKPL